MPANAVGVATAACLTGERLIGVGGFWQNNSPDNTIEEQLLFGNIAVVRGVDGNGSLNGMTVQAVCLD
jgi:hypothetical protein